jgi:hypothetical protein
MSHARVRLLCASFSNASPLLYCANQSEMSLIPNLTEFLSMENSDRSRLSGGRTMFQNFTLLSTTSVGNSIPESTNYF